MYLDDIYHEAIVPHCAIIREATRAAIDVRKEILCEVARSGDNVYFVSEPWFKEEDKALYALLVEHEGKGIGMTDGSQAELCKIDGCDGIMFTWG